ncbi:hypothetical protein EXIGLDRAFT_24403 [Exidia glandulosa HHB12029]|uniref:Uncharacterized protein n=1 Tax=Exidia glandulosa HHB12029 TaxID=1314781 RepID=A0A166BVI5_EXIGL|nr:hypothetical protein EXIGLDRAFT_24403 [Exidia glandulosa HHB12029]
MALPILLPTLCVDQQTAIPRSLLIAAAPLLSPRYPSLLYSPFLARRPLPLQQPRERQPHRPRRQQREQQPRERHPHRRLRQARARPPARPRRRLLLVPRPPLSLPRLRRPHYRRPRRTRPSLRPRLKQRPLSPLNYLRLRRPASTPTTMPRRPLPRASSVTKPP